MKHLGILILVYISLLLLFFTHILILKQNCLWDLDDKIESVKIYLEEPDRRKEVIPLLEQQLKELIEEREKEGVWIVNGSSYCHSESWGSSKINGWIYILGFTNLDHYLSWIFRMSPKETIV